MRVRWCSVLNMDLPVRIRLFMRLTILSQGASPFGAISSLDGCVLIATCSICDSAYGVKIILEILNCK